MALTYKEIQERRKKNNQSSNKTYDEIQRDRAGINNSPTISSDNNYDNLYHLYQTVAGKTYEERKNKNNTNINPYNSVLGSNAMDRIAQQQKINQSRQNLANSRYNNAIKDSYNNRSMLGTAKNALNQQLSSTPTALDDSNAYAKKMKEDYDKYYNEYLKYKNAAENKANQTKIESQIEDADERLRELKKKYQKEAELNRTTTTDMLGRTVYETPDYTQNEDYLEEASKIADEKTALKAELDKLEQYIDYSTEDDFNKYKTLGNADPNNAVRFFRTHNDEQANKQIDITQNGDVDTLHHETAYTGSAGNDSDRALFRAITDEEADNYAYLLGKYGQEEADEYLQKVAQHTDVNGVFEKLEEAKKKGYEHGIQGSAESVALGLATPFEFAKNVFSGDDYRTVDDYALANRQNYLRQGTAERIADETGDEDVLPFLYNTGMSTADNLLRYAAGNVIGGLAGVGASEGIASKMAEGTMRGMMAGQVMDQSMSEALNRGLSDKEAVTTALISAFNEELFETLSLEQLKSFKASDVKGIKDIIKNAGKQFVTEGSEEVFTDIGNAIADDLINGDNSQIQQDLREYINNGMSVEEARKKVATDFALQLVESGLSGGLSGVGMGAGVSAQTFANLRNTEKYDTLVDNYKSQGYTESEARNMANEALQSQSAQNIREVFNGKSVTVGGALNKAIKAAAKLTENVGAMESEVQAQEEQAKYAQTDNKNITDNSVIANNATTDNKPNYDDLYQMYSNVNQRLFNQDNAQQTESSQNANANNNIENYIANIEKTDIGQINALQKDTRTASKFEKDLFDFVTNAPTNAVDSEDFAKSLDEIFKKHPGEKDTIINAASAIVNNAGNDFLNDYFGENLAKIDFKNTFNDNLNAEQLKYNANLNGENVELVSANGDNVTVRNELGQEQTVKNSDLQTTEGGQAAIDVAKTYGKKGSELYLGNLTSNVRAYTNSFNTFYNAGRNGTDFGNIQATNYDNLSKDSQKAMKLALEIYYAGSTDSGTNSKVGGLVRNENRHKIDERVARTLNACGKAFGVTIELDGKISHDANGVYEDGRIHISLDTDNPVAVVLAHEFTHRLKQTSPDAYKNYEKYVIDALKAENVYEERAGKLKLAYEKQGVHLSEADVNEELAANASETFLMDEDFVKDIVTKDRKLADQILDVIQKLIDDIKSIIVKDYQTKTIEAKVISEYAEGKYLAKAKELWKTAIEQQNKELMAKENAKDSEEKYSIREFEDGRKFVEVDTDQDIFKGHDRSEYPEIAKKYMQEHFQGKILGITNKAFFNGTGKKEYVNPAKKIINKEIYDAKVKSSTELDNLIEAGEFLRNEPDGRDGHIHENNTGGFDYYKVLFKVDDNYFEGIVNIEIMNMGRLFKDITKIKDVTKDITSSYGINPKSRSLRTSSIKDSISQKSQQSNNNNRSFSLKEDSEGRKLSEQQQEYFKDSQVRDAEGKLQVLYHQTDADFTVFNTRNKGGGASDYITPYGIFMKPGNNNIGLKGNKQMKLYANITNMLNVNNREELERLLKKDSNLEKAINSMNTIDEEYKAKYDAADKASMDYMKSNSKPGQRLKDDPELDRLFEEEQKILDEWSNAYDVRAAEVKEKVDEYLKSQGYDGVHILNDQGSFGRRVETYIAFNANQVKNTDNANPTKNKDIRYSLKADRNEIEKVWNNIKNITPDELKDYLYKNETEYHESYINTIISNINNLKKATQYFEQFAIAYLIDTGRYKNVLTKDNKIDFRNYFDMIHEVRNDRNYSKWLKNIFSDAIYEDKLTLDKYLKERETTSNDYDVLKVRKLYQDDVVKYADAYINNELSKEDALKFEQFRIVDKYNPPFNDQSYWIRSPKDIMTFEEALNDEDALGIKPIEDGLSYPDVTAEMLQKALKTGEITVYHGGMKKGIHNGDFVTPSYEMALEYGGTPDNVYSKKVKITDVAWLDAEQGMYANKKSAKFSLKEDSEGRELSKQQQEYFKDSKVVDENGNLKVMYHGTETPGFTTFNPSNRKGYSDNYNAIFLTDNKDVADTYTNNKGVYPLYVNAENPYVVDVKGQTFHNWSVKNYDKKYTNIQLEPSSEGQLFAMWHEDDNPKMKYGTFTKEELKDKFGEKIGIFNFADDTYIGVIYLDKNGNNIPTSTDDCILHAKNNGYDSVIFNNIKDMGRFADDYKESQVVAVFNSNQVKNVDNLNPTDNPDIRFSLKEDSPITNNTIAEITSKNEFLADEIKNLEDMLTSGRMFFKANQRELFQVYDEIAKEYKINNYSKKQFADNMNILFEYIADVDNPDPVTTMTLATMIAYDMIDTAGIKDTWMQEEYEGLQDFVKARRLTISDQDKNDLDGGYDYFRKKYFGKLTLVKDGISVDSEYQELNGMYPELFPENITHPAEQLMRIGEVMDMFDSVVDSVEGATREESAFIIARDILDKTLLNNTRGKEFDTKEKLRFQEKLRKSNTNLNRAKRDIKEEYEILLNKVKAIEGERKRLERANQRLERQMGKQMKDFADFAADEKALKKAGKLQRENERLKAKFAKQEVAKQQRKYSQERRKNLEKIKKMTNELSRSLLHPDKTHYVPRGLVASMLEVAKMIDLDSGYRNPDGSMTNIYMKLKEMQNQYRKMSEDGDYAISSEYNETVDKAIGRIAELTKGKRVNELMDKDIEEVADIMTIINHELKVSRDIINGENLKDVKEAAEKGISQIKAANRVFNKDKRLKNLLNGYLNNMLSPVRVFKRLENYAHDGVMSELGHMLEQGERKTKVIKYKAMDMLADLTKDKEAIKKYEEFRTKKLNYTIGGKTITITPDMRVAIYLHSLNEQNMKHLSGNKDKDGVYHGGGVIIPNYNKAMLAKDRLDLDPTEKYTGVGSVRLSPETVKKIVGDMTDYEKMVAEKYREVNNYLTEELNKTTMDLYGFKKATVENYFPLIVDKSILQLESEGLKMDKTLESFGFLKERVNSAKPIYLEGVMDALYRQIDQSSLFSGMAIPTRNFSKVYNYTTQEEGNENGQLTNILKESEKAFGSYMTRYIDNLKADLAQARDKSTSEVARLFSRGKMATGVLTGNLSVVFKQMASYPTAAGGDLDFRDLIAGLSYQGQSGKDLTELINKYSPYLRDRNTSTIAGMNVTDLNVLQRKNPKLYYALTGWIEATDKATVRRLWYASENYVKRNYKLKVGSDEYYEQVAEVWEDTLRRTQPIYDTMSRPEDLRQTGEIKKWLMMFKTQAFQNIGIMVDSFGELKARNEDYKNNKSQTNKELLIDAQRQFRKAVTSQIVQSMVFAAMTALADAIKHRPDDWVDEETGQFTAESFLKNYADAIINNTIGQLAYGDIIRDFTYGPLKALMGKDTYRFDTEIIPISVINDTLNTVQKMAQYTNKLASLDRNDFATEKEYKTAIKGYTDKLGEQAGNIARDGLQYGLGLPINNVEKLLNGITANVEDIRNGKNPLNVSSDKQTFNRIFNAYKAGDPNLAEDLSADIDDSKLKTQMVNRLKEEDEIKEAADYRYNGETDKYQAIIDAYVNAGFDDSWVISAVNSDMNKKYGTSGSTTSSIYNANDLERAIDVSAVQGSKVAKQIYDDKVEDYKAQGQSTDDAKKKAFSSVKSSITSKYKSKYENGSTHEKVLIRDTLVKLRIDGKQIYTYDDIKNWNN